VLVFAADDAPPRGPCADVDWSGLLAPDTAVFRLPGRWDRALLGPGHRRIAEILDSRISRRLEDLME
jgi:hypothetical protein